MKGPDWIKNGKSGGLQYVNKLKKKIATQMISYMAKKIV